MTRILDRVPDTVRDRLDDWRFWVAVAYFGLAFLMVWLYFVNARTSREQEARKAACIASIPGLQKVNTHLRGVNDLAETLTLNSFAVLAATTKDDPQYRTRRANLGRLMAAREKIGAVSELPVPTVAQCNERG